MNLHKYILTAGLCLLSSAVYAEVLWLSTSYDYGVIREEDGKQRGEVRFVNLTDEPVNILEARPSCGCTTSFFTEDPVEKGDTAVISFVYDPAGRPGAFEKNLRVRLSGGKLYRIPIKGNVLGSPETLAKFYPVDAGALRLSEDKIPGGNIVKGKLPTLFLTAYNTMPDSVDVTLTTGHPALIPKLSADRVGPGELVTIMVSFDSRKWEGQGKVEIPVTITAGDSGPFNVEFLATVTEFSMMNNEDKTKKK